MKLSNEGADQFADGSALDNAGNSASARVEGINIDLTAPTLTGAPTTDANAAGWYKDDVDVNWTGDDGLSGIDPATAAGRQPDHRRGLRPRRRPGQRLRQGRQQRLGFGHRDQDRPDRTGISGAPETAPNAAGWYSGDVVVGFSCTDDLSGVASCPSDKLVSGNGADQTVTSAPATDLAGNASAGKTVGGINIDGPAPQTIADNQCTKTNGWCTGSSATVVLTATDQAGLSGVKEIHYTVNGGPEQVAAGREHERQRPARRQRRGRRSGTSRSTTPATRSPERRRAQVRQHRADGHPHAHPGGERGRVEQQRRHRALRRQGQRRRLRRRRRGTTPTSSSKTRRPVSRSTARQDIAGNLGTDSVTVKLDKTAPSISGAIVSGQLGNGGWYTGPVTVDFTCTDALSGVAVCPDDVTLTENGATSR